MSPLTALRWSGGLWALPLVFGAGSLHAATSLVNRSGYTVSDVASASYVIYMVVPVLAGLAAYRMRRWPEFHRTLRTRRSGLVVIGRSFAPLLLGGPLVVVVTVLIASGSLPRDAATWSVLGVDAATTLACVLLGMVLGWGLPAGLAVPLVSVGTFFWVALPPSTSSPWLHYLTPTVTGCCSSAVQPDGTFVLALLTITGVVAVATMALLVPRRWSRLPRAVVLTVAFAAVLAGTLGGVGVLAGADRPLTLTAVEARSAPPECSRVRGLEVCLWPEAAGRAAELADIAAEVDAAVTRAGLPPIRGIRSGDARTDDGVIAVQPDPTAGRRGLQLNVANAYVRDLIPCAEERRTLLDRRASWIVLAAGWAAPGAAGLRGEFLPADIAAARRHLPAAGVTPDPGEVRAWFLDSARARCVAPR